MNPTYARSRYIQVHNEWFTIKYPEAFKDHGCPDVKYPKVLTSNGMITWITNFLNWSRHRATRISVSGRLIDAPKKQASGITLMTKRYMHSQTRKGTADISATINGRSVMLEIKAGRDRPSEYQLAEQKREQDAGGVYLFIHTVDEFLHFYDTFTE